VLQRIEQAHDDAIWSVAWKRRELGAVNLIATGSLDSSIKIWNWDETNQLQPVRTIEQHRMGIICTDLNHNASVLVSNSTDNAICTWDMETGDHRATIDPGSLDSWNVRFSPDGRLIATGSVGGCINLYSMEGQLIDTFEAPPNRKFVLAIAFSPDGQLLATSSQEGIIYVYDVETRKVKYTIEHHAMPVRSLAFSPDSKLMISGSDDKYVKAHDVNTDKSSLVATFSGHKSWVLDVDFSPTGKSFVSSSADNTVRVWDIARRQTEHLFSEHSDQVWGVRYNADGSRLVSVGEDKLIAVYSIPS